MNKPLNEKKAPEIQDMVTGKNVPMVGSEENRQAVERILLEELGYAPEEIGVGEPLRFEVDGEAYETRLDLVIRIHERPFAVIRCVAGSVGAAEREALAAARILSGGPALLAVSTDGNLFLKRMVSGGKKAEGNFTLFPSRKTAGEMLHDETPALLPPEKLRRERLVFRTFDMDRVNVAKI